MLNNSLDIPRNVELDVCQIIPLVPICMLITVKRGHELIIKFEF